jgi:hypothetical protein
MREVFFGVERAAGIEPATLAWKARALPLCNARDRSRSRVGEQTARVPLGGARRSLVGRAGFEPAYRFREPNLQSGAINHSTTDPRWGPAEIRDGQIPFLLLGFAGAIIPPRGAQSRVRKRNGAPT